MAKDDRKNAAAGSPEAVGLREAAVKAAAAGDGAEAVRLWNECIRLDPRDAEALANLGWYELSRRRAWEAIPFYLRALAERPGWEEVLADLVDCYRLLGEWTEAEQTAESALCQHPDSGKLRAAVARMRRASFWWRWGRRLQALRVIGPAAGFGIALWQRVLSGLSCFLVNILEAVQYRRSRGYTATEPRESRFRLSSYIAREHRRLGWRNPIFLSYPRAIEYPLVTQAMGPLEGKRVLDIGGAECPMAFDWAGLGADVTVVDPSDPAAHLRGHPLYRALEEQQRPDLLRADGCFLPFRDEVFDAVVSISTVEHIPGDGDTRVMVEAARVLRPGGRVVVTVEGGPSLCEEWFGTSVVGVQYAANAEGKRRPAASEWGLLVRMYTLEAARERLLRPTPLEEIDCGVYDDVVIRGRGCLEGALRPWVKALFREACPLAAQVSYRRLPPGRNGKPGSTVFLVATKPGSTPSPSAAQNSSDDRRRK